MSKYDDDMKSIMVSKKEEAPVQKSEKRAKKAKKEMVMLNIQVTSKVRDQLKMYVIQSKEYSSLKDLIYHCLNVEFKDKKWPLIK